MFRVPILIPQLGMVFLEKVIQSFLPSFTHGVAFIFISLIQQGHISNDISFKAPNLVRW